MIAGTYLVSAVLLVGVAILFNNGGATDPAFSDWGLTAALGVTFFFASAGASSAYLTVSEIFPMEVRALAIAFFYAIGTAIGGITGPLVFQKLAESGDPGQVAIGYLVGAAVMAFGGIAEIFLGVRAEGKSLEDIAKPLTARDAEEGADGGEAAEQPSDEDRAAARHRERERRQRIGARRYRPGPGSASYSPFFGHPAAQRPEWIDLEVDRIASAVQQAGETDLRSLATAVGARSWGPGRFRAAVREALDEGVIRRTGRGRFAPPPERS
jgi:hypothetical protein